MGKKRGFRMNNKEEPLLLLSDKLFDLQKGKGNRDGLIQQIVTYVRDGRTVTRKQWVRSEFADHAKKDEEEKKDVEVHKQERQRKQREKNLKDGQDKQINADKRALKKEKGKADEEEHKHYSRNKKVNSKAEEKFKKEISKLADEDAKSKATQSKGKDGKDKDDKDDDKGDKKKKRSAYGQKDETKADNKRQLDLM